MSVSNMYNEDLRNLFNGLKQNDRSKFETLYENYNRLVYKIAFSILRNNEDSEDIVQIVFSKLYEMDPSKLPTKKEASWLYSVTKNEVITLLRKKKNYIDISSIYDIQSEDNEFSKIVDKEWFFSLINKLNDREKEIVSLKILTDLSFEEISKILDEPTGTVKWRYYKAVNTLKILLSNLGMFILTFCIGLKLYTKEIEQDKSQVNNETAENITVDDNYSHIEMIPSNVGEINEEVQNTVENTVQPIETTQKWNTVGLGILSISGVFLVFSIIFSIIFTKYQLKRAKKGSKFRNNKRIYNS